MAINLAVKYSSVTDEIIRKGALSGAGVNNEVSFVGAQTVKIYTMGTAPLNDYRASGSNRYGTPVELEDTLQEMTMTQQKSFTFTIDKTNEVDTPEGVREAGKALRRQIDMVIVPEIDRYRFAKLAENAGTKSYKALTAETAYTSFVAANTAITDEEFPTEGRVAFCSNSFIELLKTDTTHFTKATDIAQDRIIFKGMVGDCDGVSLIAVPKRRLPAGVSFIITHPMCAPAPVKLQEYKIHKDPPGIAGHLVEGLLYHDIFVFENKKKAVSVVYGSMGELTVAMTATTSGKGTVVVSGDAYNGTLVYKTNGSVTAPAIGTDISSWEVLPEGGEITATSGNKLVVAIRNAEGKAVATSTAVTVSVGA